MTKSKAGARNSPILKPIEIFGLQRSGTNYLTKLLEENFYVEVVNKRYEEGINWKHSLVVPDSPYPKILIRKGVMNWIDSIANRNKVDYVETQRMFPSDLYEEEFMYGKNQLNIKQLTSTWVYWLNNLSKGTEIEYEKFISSPRIYLILIAEVFNLEKRNKELKTDLVISQSEKFTEEDKTKYVIERDIGLTEKQFLAIYFILSLHIEINENT